MQQAPKDAAFTQQLTQACSQNGEDCIRAIEEIAATVIPQSGNPFPDAAKLAQLGLAELALHHLHDTLQVCMCLLQCAHPHACTHHWAEAAA